MVHTGCVVSLGAHRGEGGGGGVVSHDAHRGVLYTHVAMFWILVSMLEFCSR